MINSSRSTHEPDQNTSVPFLHLPSHCTQKQRCDALATSLEKPHPSTPCIDPVNICLFLALESPPSAATSSRQETSLVSPPAASIVTLIGPVAPPAPTGGKETRLTCSLNNRQTAPAGRPRKIRATHEKLEISSTEDRGRHVARTRSGVRMSASG